jgi:hypothetical protein
MIGPSLLVLYFLHIVQRHDYAAIRKHLSAQIWLGSPLWPSMSNLHLE